MNLSSEQAAELRTLAAGRHVTADVALRARIVLWAGEGRRRKDIAEWAGVSARTVDRTRIRYAEHGVAGLMEKKRGGGKEQMPPQTRGRVIALTRMTPPPESGLSHWEYGEWRSVAHPEQTLFWPPARNGSCWCDSGRKYKKCCGSPANN